MSHILWCFRTPLCLPFQPISQFKAHLLVYERGLPVWNFPRSRRSKKRALKRYQGSCSLLLTVIPAQFQTQPPSFLSYAIYLSSDFSLHRKKQPLLLSTFNASSSLNNQVERLSANLCKSSLYHEERPILWEIKFTLSNSYPVTSRSKPAWRKKASPQWTHQPCQGSSTYERCIISWKGRSVFLKLSLITSERIQQLFSHFYLSVRFNSRFAGVS